MVKTLSRTRTPVLLVSLCAVFASANLTRAEVSPSPAAGSPSLSPSASPATTPVPLADIVAASDAAGERLDQINSEISSNPTNANIARDLPQVTAEIAARVEETRRMLVPGVPLETMRDLENRWQKLNDQLALWTRDLTERATYLDRATAQMPELRATWRSTLELARTSSAPAELTQRIDDVLKRTGDTEAALQKRRASLLSLQTRVAEQTQRVQGAMRSIKTAQSAAVSQLWTQDSAPIWNPEIRTAASRAFTRDSQASFGMQFVQLRAYAAREWTKFIYLALIFLALSLALLRIKRQAARWTDQDPALERANRVLHLPVATAGILTFLFCRPLFDEAPRLFWLALATVALIPIVILLRHLMERHFFPILNALVVFYVLAQVRALAAGLPVLSRIILLLEMVGGGIFLVWFIRFTRVGVASTTARKATRAAARVGVVLFAVVFFANSLGYVGLANYLATGSLAAGYLAILLYAAAEILEGLVFFAFQIRPISSLAVVQHHRPLLRRRIARVIYVAAFLIWLLLTLNSFSMRDAAFQRVGAILNAEVAVRSLHLSLGAVLAFFLTIWLTILLSRFVRFLLEEEVYDRLRLARGSSYAVSTLLHYVILLVGFYAALAALGADMTKFAILAGAFGVGIGFGLQNIFNNFFSGLILLFERPVQVGDVIEVGNATGLVRRIGIRASIILLADSSQLIIPNGQLISDKVTNRTRSSRQKTITLSVRIAYGSDPAQVILLLTKTAAAHERVVEKPAPAAFLKEFGADALLFDLSFTTNDVDNALRVHSDVAVAVNAALHEAGIEIPFPQRRLQLETIASNIPQSGASGISSPAATPPASNR